MATFLLTSVLLLSFFTISSPTLPLDTLNNAVEILSDSGFVAMSLTLQLLSQTLILQSSPSATIFAPSDPAFSRTGQPNLDLLQYHFSPVKFSLETLKSLPFGTKIPTMFANHSLIVTSSGFDGKIEINNVPVNSSAIFDVGSLAVFGIDEFFDPSFEVSSSSSLLPPSTGTDLADCVVSSSSSVVGGGDVDDDDDDSASAPLISRGYSVMASFLDLQLPRIRGDKAQMMTVFAPVDQVMDQYSGNFSLYASIFHRHVLPCKFSWSDLVNLDEGVSLRTFSDGFTITVTRSGDVLVLNGVPVIFPDMYTSNSLVVHGLQQIITSPTERQSTTGGESFAEFDRSSRAGGGGGGGNHQDYDELQG